MEGMMKRCAYGLAAVFFVGLFSLTLASEAEAAIYVWVHGIQGEATDKDHRNWIDAKSVNHQMKNSGTMHVGGGGGAGKVDYGDFVVLKEIDKATPKLNLLCANGKHIPEVIIEMTASYTDAGRVTYLQYKLERVQVSSVDTSFSGGSQDPGTETVTLNFGKITCIYTESDDRGKKKGKVAYSWDVEKNKEEPVGQKSPPKPSGQTKPRYVPRQDRKIPPSRTFRPRY
jgi:type VI secretion system secreted protein Hcp